MIHNISSSSHNCRPNDSPRPNKTAIMFIFFSSVIISFLTRNSSQSNRFRLFYKILHYRVLFSSLYQCCYLLSKKYIVISKDKTLKYAECTRWDKPYIDISWETTERLKDRARKKFSVEKRYRDKLLEQLSVVQA